MRNISEFQETYPPYIQPTPGVGDVPPTQSKTVFLNEAKKTPKSFWEKLKGLGGDYGVPKHGTATTATPRFAIDKQFTDLYGITSTWGMKTTADDDYANKDFTEKREVLEALSLQPELGDILDTLTDECIVYDARNVYYCQPVSEDIPDDKLAKTYREVYSLLNMQTEGWSLFRRFLIDGVLAWEIVYDSNTRPKKIVSINQLDPGSLTKKYKDDGEEFWVQYSGMMGKERTLRKNQIIYLSYQDSNSVSHLSYLERLIRPYNIYRIIEQSQLVWTVSNSAYRMQITIPVKGQNEARGRKTLASAMSQYQEDIKFVADTGELTIRGQSNLPFSREYWLPETDSGTPSISVLGGDGPSLADSDQLHYFKNMLYKASKIPLSRFDENNDSFWSGGDATQTARTEINFGRFVGRLRAMWTKVLMKPLQIALALEDPSLLKTPAILNSIVFQYTSYNVFEEMMELELQQKRVDFVESIKDCLIDQDSEGADVKFFSSAYLANKYLKLSAEDREINNNLKKKEMEKYKLAGTESKDDDDGGW